MDAEMLLTRTVENFWDTIPPVWSRVRNNARASAVQDFGLTLIQFHILRHIRHGAHTAAEIAELQQISRPAVSQAVDILVEKGLVTRQASIADRRYVRLELTGPADELLDALFARTRAWMGEKMACLRPAELETVDQALAILKRAFDPALD